MLKKTYGLLNILCIITLLFITKVNGQSSFFRKGNEQLRKIYKYGFTITKTNGRIRPTTREVIQYISQAKNDTTQFQSSDGRIISLLPVEDSFKTPLPSNICDTFRVISISVKKNNYYVLGNRLRKTKMLMYDVKQDFVKDSDTKYIRIIDFQHISHHKLKTGNIYLLTLIPFLKNDCCSPNYVISENDTVYSLRQSREFSAHIINDVLVPYFNFKNYNYMEIQGTAVPIRKRIHKGAK